MESEINMRRIVIFLYPVFRFFSCIRLRKNRCKAGLNTFLGYIRVYYVLKTGYPVFKNQLSSLVGKQSEKDDS